MALMLLGSGCDAGGDGPPLDGGATLDSSTDDVSGPLDAPAVTDSPPVADRHSAADSPQDDVPVGYSEPMCDDTASLAELASRYVYSTAGLREAVTGIVLRRYPMGAAVLAAQDDAQLAAWFPRSDTFEGVLGSIDVGVREGGRAWDAAMSNATRVYRVRDDMVIHTRRMSTFALGEIITYHADPASDTYADAHLTGRAGAQGLEGLLADYVHYTHALAAKHCTRDGIPRGARVAARDDILTMMYYVELYLMTARMRHPADYAAIVADPGHRQLIRTVWQRAEFWLAASAAHPELGTHDAQIEAWTYAPSNLLEVTRLPE